MAVFNLLDGGFRLLVWFGDVETCLLGVYRPFVFPEGE